MVKEYVDYKYRKELIDALMEELKNLNPHNFAMRSLVDGFECENCHEEGSFYKLPEFHYGRCRNCGHEKGFEYYDTVMMNRMKQYEDVVEKVKTALGV